MSLISEPSFKKVVKEKKTGKEKTLEIKRNYKAVPLRNLALVCPVCGREKPILKLKVYTPRFCEYCGVTLELRITKSLSHTCWSDNLQCLKIADKFQIKRIK